MHLRGWEQGDALRIDTPDGWGAGWYVVSDVEPQYDPEGYVIPGACSISLIPDPTNTTPSQSSEP